MTALIARLIRQGVFCRFGPLAFCAVWLGLAIVFAGLALTARRSTHVQISRSGFRLPSNPNIQLGAVRLQHVINDLAEKHDKTAASLERSIRASARTSFWVNLTAAFLSVVGFAAQLESARRTDRAGRGSTTPWPKEDGGQLTFSNGRASPSNGPTPVIHDGCFPGGGYGR